MRLDAEAIRALAPQRLYALDGRVALVTGAGGGLGEWLAAGLGAAGARLLLTDLDEERLAATETALRAAGIATASLAADLAAEDTPARLVAAAHERLGGLDVLVNNAGVNRREPIVEVERATFDWILDVDLRAPYFLAQAAARSLIEAGRGGAVVNVCSLSSFHGLGGVSVYGAAKGALAQLTRTMAVEWAPHGIRANGIAPGFMETPLSAPVWADPDRARWFRNRIPLKRPGRPDELVGLLLLLASDAGSYLTGQTFLVDGGALAGGSWYVPDE